MKYNEIMQANDIELIYKDECYAIRGAIFAVYKELGCGFLEEVYQEALEKELGRRGIPFESQKRIRIMYRGELLEKEYVPDLICYGKIILELKVAKVTADVHRAQLICYLKATQFRLGLLVNFGTYPRVDVLPSLNE